MDRYDRQTRLWGEAGQRRLSQAHIVALGCTATVAETLKGMVLSGVHAVTLVDDRLVTAEDLSSNYFVEMPTASSPHEGDGEPEMRHMAIAVQHTLQALNESCIVRAVLLSPHVWVRQCGDALLTHSPSATNACHISTQTHTCTSSNTCCRASNLPAPSLLLASDRMMDFSFASPCAALARRTSVPLLCVESHGLVGYVKTYAADRVVTQPGVGDAFAVRDLRLFDPFPALAAWFAAHAPQQMGCGGDDDETQAAFCFRGAMAERMPYICILYHAYKLWCAAKDREGNWRGAAVRLPPFTATEYTEIAQYVLTLAPTTTSSSPSPRTAEQAYDATRRVLPASFQEAYERCNTGLNYPYSATPPSSLRVLFDDPRCTSPRRAVREAMRNLLYASDGTDDEEDTSPQYAWHDVRAVLLEQPDVLSRYVLYALRLYYSNNSTSNNTASGHRSRLPVCGYVPDMTTSSQWYGELCAIYATQYDADVAEMEAAAWARLVQDWQPNDRRDVDRHTSEAALQRGDDDAMLRDLLHELTAQVVRNVWHVRLVSFGVPQLACLSASFEMPGSHTSAAQLWRRVLAQRVFAHVSAGEADGCACDVDYTEGNAESEMQWLSAIKLAILAAQEVRRIAYNDLLDASAASRAHSFTYRDLLSCFPGEGEEDDDDVCDAQKTTAPQGTVHSATPIGRVYPHLLQLLITGHCLAHSAEHTLDDEQLAASARRTLTTSWPYELDVVHDASGLIVPQKVLRAACWEVERMGACELAVTAAIVGGMAAAEATKLLTRMRVPQGTDLFYNGLLSVTGTLADARRRGGGCSSAGRELCALSSTSDC